MQKENYQIVLERTLKTIEKEEHRPRLLLHSCCGPCSSYVLEYLSHYFDITVYYYNPNISPAAEFTHRAEEQQKLIAQMPLEGEVSCIVGEYDPETFFAMAKGREQEPEGGQRCFDCYTLRLAINVPANCQNSTISTVRITAAVPSPKQKLKPAGKPSTVNKTKSDSKYPSERCLAVLFLEKSRFFSFLSRKTVV